MEKRPKTIGEYKEWLKTEQNIAVEDRDEVYYGSVTSKIKEDFKASEFWIQLIENLEVYNQEYQLRTGYLLLIPRFEPELKTKPYGSFLLKTQRKNILENKSWPKEPEGGWYLPSNWFSRIDDILRTLLVVRYFDGVDFVINKIDYLCKEHDMECKVFYEAREEGYYAAHLYTKREFEIPTVKWDTEKRIFSIEIQITTQLQEVIRKLLHKYYEQKRKAVKELTTKWQWDYKCDEFCANYLGHILHYVEGMIMEIREKQREMVF